MKFIEYFIEHNSTISTWLTTFLLLIFPAYDLFSKRKRLAIRIYDGIQKNNLAEFNVKIINQNDYPISITKIKVNLFDEVKKGKDVADIGEISEIKPRDYQVFRIKTGADISKNDIFSLAVTGIDEKIFKLYPNGKTKSFVRKYLFGK